MTPLDLTLLDQVPTLSFNDPEPVAAWGGMAILPWRAEYRAARAAGIDARGEVGDLAPTSFAQAVVRVERDRGATWSALAAAWSALAPAGRLVLVGSNEQGIRGTLRRLGQELGQEAELLDCRGHGRAAGFRRDEGPGPQAADEQRVVVPDLPGADDGELVLRVPCGVFADSGIDAGTALLLAHLDDSLAPARVLDCCCGAGYLGLAAALRWPTARIMMVDADHRAVMAAWENAEALGVAGRCDAAWWDSSEPLPLLGPVDLALINPPAHREGAVDVGPGRRAVTAAASAVSAGGSLLLVANRRLPYEDVLGAHGRVDTVASTTAFKVLHVRCHHRGRSRGHLGA